MKKIILALILFLVSYTGSPAQDFHLKIHFIDIGEGDSILIQANDKTALIDTGNILSGQKLADYLKANGVGSITHLIITHHDLDHISGAFFVIPKFRIENFYDNGFNLDTKADSMLYYYEKIFRANKNYKVLKEKDVLKLGDVILEVLWPQDGVLAGSFNYNSLVIMLKYGNFKCLLTADIDSETERELLRKGTDLSADILKVAHHGANDSTSESFLTKINPKLDVISVDADNRRGYPAKSVLEILKRRDIKTYRTDKNGSVLVTIKNDFTYDITVEKSSLP